MDPYFERSLIHECDVAAPGTHRVGGEVQVTYGTDATISCRHVPYTERWTDEGRSRQIYRRHRLLLAPDAEIGRKYRVRNIKVSNGVPIDDGPFIVTETLKMGDGQGVHHIEVEMERSE